jgi:aldehyde:ferredoxin oxidoreductase
LINGGYMQRLGFVDLCTQQFHTEEMNEEWAWKYVGGYGLGVRVLFERQPAKVYPLGPQNILGFTTGPLTGVKVPTGGRYMTVCKSPLTGGWGDANSGGYFGSALKSTGLDALFVSGISDKPVYLLVTADGIKIRDAAHLWGQDTIDTEEMIYKELGTTKVCVACIGPASERLSLISGILNDKGRMCARSGVGAVMGSKMLKAVVVNGNIKIPVADANKLKHLSKSYINQVKKSDLNFEILSRYGTCGYTGSLIASGATPIKNWKFAGEQAFPDYQKIADGDKVIQYQIRKYGCANCPIACGGILDASKGRYKIGETRKPEYETIAAFGPLCLNDDLESIIKMNDICNRAGLDTISAGTVLAFAMECAEKNVLTRSDMDGIQLTWGNYEAMIEMLQKMIKREGFGDILADGVKKAAEKIGNKAEAIAVHIGGQEPGLHGALYMPSRGTGMVCDPTPGRHTATPMARIDTGSARIGPYPGLNFEGYQRYEYKSKGPASAIASSFYQVACCAGICMMPVLFFGNYPLLEFLNATTGYKMELDECLQTGARIQTLRQCFNIREGFDPTKVKIPGRLIGNPPIETGPLKNRQIDIDSLAQEYRKAMGWDPNTGHPTAKTLERLNLAELWRKYGSSD